MEVLHLSTEPKMSDVIIMYRKKKRKFYKLNQQDNANILCNHAQVSSPQQEVLDFCRSWQLYMKIARV